MGLKASFVDDALNSDLELDRPYVFVVIFLINFFYITNSFNASKISIYRNIK